VATNVLANWGVEVKKKVEAKRRKTGKEKKRHSSQSRDATRPGPELVREGFWGGLREEILGDSKNARVPGEWGIG